MAPATEPAPRSTVVALVGGDSEPLLSGLADVPAVRALSLRAAHPAEAARAVVSAASPYVVHDADPLEHVAAAWVELYEERATLGTLEVEVQTFLDLFAHGEPEFDQWRWERLERVVDIAAPFKREVYERVIAAFRAFAAA